MNLKEMKAIAEKRTKGIWGYTYFETETNRDRDIGIVADYGDGTFDGTYGDTIIERDSGVYGPNEKDADFIIMAANKLDALIAVVEAVKRMQKEAILEKQWYIFLPCHFAEDVDDALEELEKDDVGKTD